MAGRADARPDSVSTTCSPRSPSHQVLENESDKYLRAQRVKKWKVFPGKNKFYCDGRIITARQSGFMYTTLCLIIVTAALFFAFDCRITLVNSFDYGFMIPTAAGILLIFSVACLLRTAWSDPGILPRASSSEAAFLERYFQARQDSQPRTVEVTVDGVPIKLKFCHTCNILRPPRSSHCSVCDNCIEGLDHHCPWVGNCVGRRNYRYFFLFIVSVLILCLYVLAFSVIHIVLLARREHGLLEALKISPTSVVVVVVSFFSLWSVIGLAGFHSYLIACGVTTNENIKGTWSSRRGGPGRNPFSRGWCGNCWYILCGPVPPSYIDRRGYVDTRASNGNMFVA